MSHGGVSRWRRRLTQSMRDRPESRQAVVVGALVVGTLAVLLGPALLGRGVLLDVNSLSGRLPFRAIAGRDFGHAITCRSDTYDYYLPGVAEIKRGLLAGQWRTWAPYEVGGAPLASLPNHGVLSPLSWPYLVLPLWLAPAFVKLAEIVAVVVGMLLFLRGRGVSPAGAWLAAFVFVTSGFMLAWTNWPHTRVAALIPLLLWATERAVRGSRTRDVAWFGLILASMLLGGFPAVTLFGLTLAGAYAVLRTWQLHRGDVRRALRALLTPVGGLALGVGLSAVQILPFAANLSAVLADRNKGGHHLPLGAALSLLAPGVRGECVGGERFGARNPIEVMGYVGCAALVLAVVAVAARRRSAGGPPRGFLTGALVVVGLVVWVGGPLLTLLDLLPFYGSNSVARAQSVVGFLVAALAAIGLDVLTRTGDRVPETGRARRGRARVARPVVVWTIAGLVLLLVVVAEVGNARQDGYAGHLARAVVVPGLLLVVALAVLAVGRTSARWSRLAPLVLVLLVVGQGAALAHVMWPLNDRTYFYPRTPTHDFLERHLGGDRYGAGDGTMNAATSDWYELRTPVGHEFTAPRWKDLLSAVDPDVQATTTYSAFSVRLPFARAARSPVLDRLAVRYWVLDPRHPVGRLEPVSSGGTTSLRSGGSATCRIGGGPLRGVLVDLPTGTPDAAEGTSPTLSVRVTGGGVTRTGEVLIGGRRPGSLSVAVAGEDLPQSAQARVTVRLEGRTGPVPLTGSGSRLHCGAVRPVGGPDDRVRLVFADAGSAIYERLDALPRIRWAGRSRVVAPDEQVAQLTAGVPDDTVLLDDGSTPVADGNARVRVVEDDRERISAEVRAQGQGYLVVGDSIARPGWHATVDGRPARVVPADHALAAVPVAAGRHRVVLRYVAPGLRAGVTVSGISVVATVGLFLLPALRRRRRDPRA